MSLFPNVGLLECLIKIEIQFLIHSKEKEIDSGDMYMINI